MRVVNVVCGPSSHTPEALVIKTACSTVFSFTDKLVLCYVERIFMLMCMW